jgi:hypothetical protein
MASDPISRAQAKRDARKQTPQDQGKLSLVEDERPLSKEDQALTDGAWQRHKEAGPKAAQSPFSEPVAALSADLSADTLPPDTAKALSALVHEHARLGSRIADLKASQDELKAEIESICFEIPAKRISGAGWHTTRSKKSTTFIDKNKLAEKGVDPDVIAYATTTNWSREFVLPVVEKEKAEK